MARAKAIFKFVLFALHCAWVVPTQGLILLITKGPISRRIPLLWHKMACGIFRLRYKVIGKPNTGKQTLYMSNHLSYMDIPVLGGLINGSFVAKSEVEGWPLFGFLAGLQQTIFIQRARSKIAKEKNILQERIEAGESLIIFPEGTSTSGFDVAPFKSSLFALATGKGNENLYVQPVTIRVLEVDGHTPSSKDERDVYAWPHDVDIDLHHHLWRFTKTKGATLEITFHEPLKASAYKDRKTLAKTCYDNVSKGLQISKAA